MYRHRMLLRAWALQPWVPPLALLVLPAQQGRPALPGQQEVQGPLELRELREVQAQRGLQGLQPGLRK